MRLIFSSRSLRNYLVSETLSEEPRPAAYSNQHTTHQQTNGGWLNPHYEDLMRVLCNYLMSSTISLPNSPLSSSLGSLCGLALTGALLLLEGLQLGDGSEAGSTIVRIWQENMVKEGWD